MDDLFEAYTRLTNARKRIQKDKDRNELKRPRRVLGEVDLNKPTVNHKVVKNKPRVQGFELLSLVATQSPRVTGRPISDVINTPGTSYHISGSAAKYKQLDTTVQCALEVTYVNPALETSLGSIGSFLEWFRMGRYDYKNNGSRAKHVKHYASASLASSSNTPNTLHAAHAKLSIPTNFTNTYQILQTKPLGKFLQLCQVQELSIGTLQVVLLFVAYSIELPVSQKICLSETFTEMKIGNSIYKLHLKWKMAE